MKRSACIFVFLFGLLFLGIASFSGCAERTDPAKHAAVADIASEARAYPAQLALARQQGLPVAMSDLARPAKTQGANAAPIYRQLGHMLRAYPLSNRELALEGLSTAPMPTPKALGFAKRALAHRARYLRIIHQAAACRSCVFHHDWNVADPTSITFPEIATIRESALLLSGQSVLMAENGQALPAVANEAVEFRLADQIAGEKILTAYQAACDIDTVAFIGMQKILFISNGDPKVAQAVQAAIAQNWHPRPLAPTLANEAAFQQGFVRFVEKAGPQSLANDPAQESSEIDLSGERAGSKEWDDLMEANAAVLLAEQMQAVSAADQPYSLAERAMREVVADSMKPLGSHLLPSLLVPNLASFVTLRAQDQAGAEVTEAGAAMLAWKASHGSFAPSLAGVLPSVPRDPFSGKPIGYRAKGGGFVVYSVGPTGRFRGGSPVSEPDQAESVFRWPLPAYDRPTKPQPAVMAWNSPLLSLARFLRKTV